MNKHTSGPWHKEFHDMSTSSPLHDFYTIRDSRNCYIARLKRLDAATWQDGQLEANASLIAAAPELLEALEELLVIADSKDMDICKCHVMLVGNTCSYCKARAAIAKATGTPK